MKSPPQESADLAALVETVKRGDYGVALIGLKQFLERHPDHEIAMGLLAACYFQIGMLDEARSLYRQLLQMHPQNALARFQLGMTCLDGEPREALSIWQPLLQVDREFMAHFHAALAHMKLDEDRQAEALLEHAARYMPESHPLRGQLDHLRSSLRSGGSHPGHMQ